MILEAKWVEISLNSFYSGRKAPSLKMQTFFVVVVVGVQLSRFARADHVWAKYPKGGTQVY